MILFRVIIWLVVLLSSLGFTEIYLLPAEKSQINLCYVRGEVDTCEIIVFPIYNLSILCEVTS